MNVFGVHDEKTLSQLADVARNARRVALMADGHLGYHMPIGGVAAYEHHASVTGVGFDIACGNAAIMTDLFFVPEMGGALESLNAAADEIAATISFGVGRSNRADDAPVDHPLFESPVWEAIPPKHRGNLLEKARQQLGTVGSGNHYVDVFADELQRVWVGVHFGSRGLGHTIASAFLALAAGKEWGDRVPETEALLDLRTPLGHDYWQLMELAGQYAYAGREWVARKVVRLLDGVERELIHNHHNFAWRETHEGEDLIVVRKGATPAFPGQLGFVGGSMGDDSVILRGREGQESAGALYSTVHGAGRIMSRTEAGGKYRGWGAKRKLVRPGKVSAEMLREWVIEGKGVVLRGGGLDEAPQAYRRLPGVLAAQGDTIEVVHTLRPLIVVMAGADEFDPYKD